MRVEDVLIIGSVIMILGIALIYIIKSKKCGVKCIGCSHGGCHHQEMKEALHKCKCEKNKT
ncbi:MAG: hypothetical protein WBO70_05970 [Erysipelotrichaceae bacterium]